MVSALPDLLMRGDLAVRAARSGADLVGYLNYIHPYRVQILGEREIAYLTNATSDDCARRIARIVTLSRLPSAPVHQYRCSVPLWPGLYE